jgi:hypothetical protein
MNLLPCPFCGGRAVLCSNGDRAALPHFVRCDNLLCCGFNTSNGVRTPEIAAKAWNERAGSPADAMSDKQKIAELREALKNALSLAAYYQGVFDNPNFTAGLGDADR